MKFVFHCTFLFLSYIACPILYDNWNFIILIAFMDISSHVLLHTECNFSINNIPIMYSSIFKISPLKGSYLFTITQGDPSWKANVLVQSMVSPRKIFDRCIGLDKISSIINSDENRKEKCRNRNILRTVCNKEVARWQYKIEKVINTCGSNLWIVAKYIHRSSNMFIYTCKISM